MTAGAPSLQGAGARPLNPERLPGTDPGAVTRAWVLRGPHALGQRLFVTLQVSVQHTRIAVTRLFPGDLHVTCVPGTRWGT